MGPLPRTSHDRYVGLNQKFADAWRRRVEARFRGSRIPRQQTVEGLSGLSELPRAGEGGRGLFLLLEGLALGALLLLFLLFLLLGGGRLGALGVVGLEAGLTRSGLLLGGGVGIAAALLLFELHVRVLLGDLAHLARGRGGRGTETEQGAERGEEARGLRLRLLVGLGRRDGAERGDLLLGVHTPPRSRAYRGALTLPRAAGALVARPVALRRFIR
jgi:hypothetical protein